MDVTATSNASLGSDDLPTEFNITWDKILVGVILYSITLITIVGNVLVLVAVKVDKKLQTTFNYYIVNLAVTDVAVAVTAMSFQATYTVLGYWPFGEIVCALWIFFDYGMTFVSVFTLILISLDRFWCVTWSVHYRLCHTKRKCVISICIVWLFMLVLWVPAWISDRVHHSEPGDCYWDPSLNKEFVFIVATLGHHGAYCIMIFCYTYVFIFMRKRAKVTGVSSVRRTVPSSMQTNSVSEQQPSTSNMIQGHVFSVSHAGMHIPQENQTLETTCDFPSQTQATTVNSLQVPLDRRHPSKGPSAAKSHTNRMSKERRVFVTLTYIIIGYAILWLPFHVVFDISIINPSLVPVQVINMAFWMAYFNSTLNPLLYNCSSPEFRQTFKQLLRRREVSDML